MPQRRQWRRLEQNCWKAASSGADYDVGHFLHVAGHALVGHMDTETRATWRLVCKQCCTQVYENTHKVSGGVDYIRHSPVTVVEPRDMPLALLNRCPNTREFMCCGSRLTSISGLPVNLQKVVIDDNRTPLDWEPLGKCAQLRHLVVSNNDISGRFEALSLARAIMSLASLQQLELCYNQLSATDGPIAGIRHIMDMLPACKGLLHLSLVSETGGTQDIAALCSALAELTSLQVLKVESDELLEREACQLLAPALKALPHLTSLKLYDTFIQQDGAEVLAGTLAAMQLQRLNLGFGNIGRGGMTVLAPSIRALGATLQKLSLVGNSIGSRGMAALASALSGRATPRLSTLHLGCNRIGKSGALHLAPVIGSLSQLVELDLAENNITAQGAAAILGPLSGLTTLERANFRENDLRSGGMAAVKAALLPLPRLAMLEVDDLTYWEDALEGSDSSTDASVADESDEDSDGEDDDSDDDDDDLDPWNAFDSDDDLQDPMQEVLEILHEMLGGEGMDMLQGMIQNGELAGLAEEVIADGENEEDSDFLIDSDDTAGSSSSNSSSSSSSSSSDSDSDSSEEGGEGHEVIVISDSSDEGESSSESSESEADEDA